MTDSRAIKADPPGYIDTVLMDYARGRIGPNVRVLLINAEAAAKLAPVLHRLAAQLDELVEEVNARSVTLGCLVKTIAQTSGQEDVLEELKD